MEINKLTAKECEGLLLTELDETTRSQVLKRKNTATAVEFCEIFFKQFIENNVSVKNAREIIAVVSSYAAQEVQKLLNEKTLADTGFKEAIAGANESNVKPEERELFNAIVEKLSLVKVSEMQQLFGYMDRVISSCAEKEFDEKLFKETPLNQVVFENK